MFDQKFAKSANCCSNEGSAVGVGCASICERLGAGAAAGAATGAVTPLFGTGTHFLPFHSQCKPGPAGASGFLSNCVAVGGLYPGASLPALATNAPDES
jgi:hypothetical protein